MKLKCTIVIAAALSLLAGNALADEDSSRSQKYDQNTDESYDSTPNHQSKQKSYLEKVNNPNMKLDPKEKHPIHKTRMGDH